MGAGGKLWLESPHGPGQGIPVTLLSCTFPSPPQGTPTASPLLCAFRSSNAGAPGALLTVTGRPAALPCVSHPYLAESGLKCQRGGRLGALHAGRGGGEGSHAVHPTASHSGDWTPGLGCTPHVCPSGSFCTRAEEKKRVSTLEPPAETHHRDPSPRTTGTTVVMENEPSGWGCT